MVNSRISLETGSSRLIRYCPDFGKPNDAVCVHDEIVGSAPKFRQFPDRNTTDRLFHLNRPAFQARIEGRHEKHEVLKIDDTVAIQIKGSQIRPVGLNQCDEIVLVNAAVVVEIGATGNLGPTLDRQKAEHKNPPYSASQHRMQYPEHQELLSPRLRRIRHIAHHCPVHRIECSKNPCQLCHHQNAVDLFGDACQPQIAALIS